MADYYRKFDGADSSADVYLQRVVYDGELRNIKKTQHPSLIDFTFGERILFGRVDMYYLPIILQQRNVRHLPNTAPGEPRIAAVNFVIDAFRELSLEFEKAVTTGKISADDPYLSNLRAYKAYKDPNIAYAEYFKMYSSLIASTLLKDSNPAKYFEEFINKLLPTIKKSARLQPFTKPGFIKSRLCPITCSGLAIEIADLSYANDDEKMEKFVNSENWDFYVNACSAYGFMIDKDIPWRIVADIGNQDYLDQFVGPRYGIYEKQTLFNMYYTRAHENYYLVFKQYLLKLYNLSTPRLTSKTEFCQTSGKQLRTLMSRLTYDLDSLKKEISEEYFLRIYFKIRFMEEESEFTDEKQQQIVNDVIRIYNADNSRLNTCLFYFEFILNKTVDYVGSVSYINTAIQARRADDLERGRISPNTIEQKQRDSEEMLTATKDGETIGEPETDWWGEPAVRTPWHPPLGYKGSSADTTEE